MTNIVQTAVLQSSWHKCWRALKANGDGLDLMQKLVAAYEEPLRKYHTVQHLAECLALFEEYAELALEPAEVAMALWFHDAIYDTRATDNEAMSAEWAQAELTTAGVSAQHIERVKQHILATRHAALPQGQDQLLVVDIDLAILGAPRPRFVEYENQIRAEYNWVPAGIFKEKRSALLRTFLARESIYNASMLHTRFECQARDNLSYSLQQLNPQSKAAATRFGPCR